MRTSWASIICASSVSSLVGFSPNLSFLVTGSGVFPVVSLGRVRISTKMKGAAGDTTNDQRF